MTLFDLTIIMALIFWTIWCTVLCALLGQSPRTDHLATAVGMIVVIVAVTAK